MLSMYILTSSACKHCNAPVILDQSWVKHVFVAHRVNLIASKPIKVYTVPSCGYLETVLVNFATTMLCFPKPWGPIIP